MLKTLPASCSTPEVAQEEKGGLGVHRFPAVEKELDVEEQRAQVCVLAELVLHTDNNNNDNK